MSTINDVAKRANVSPATVSKAFNNHKDIGESTRERILAIAKELDYTPSRSAIQLASGKEDTLGVIMSMIGKDKNTPEWLIKILNGIYNRAEYLGYRVQLFTNLTTARNQQNYVQFCRSNKLMGLIVHGLDKDAPDLIHLAESEIPCVLIDLDISGHRKTTVSVANEAACIEVVYKLAGLGHTEIAFVSGAVETAVAADRLRGYQKGMQKVNLPHTHIIQSNFTEEDAYAKTKNYLLQNPQITALFCASDAMAVGALNACLDLGYLVPQDISVVGFDNLSYTKYVRPQLSTVSQNFFEIGTTSAQLLVDLFNGEKVESHYYLDYEVEFRQSVSRNRKGIM